RIAVPVRVAGAQWGAAQVKATRPGAFDEDDVGLVEAIAEHVGAALQSALRLAEARSALDAARAAEGRI
ncbi:MAG: GAF domain-containing protein, partial [Actinomycetota bacterium]|nr:GAF domain-containing protein [Actinomycetota bacterium]